jgi:hypothetical protein
MEADKDPTHYHLHAERPDLQDHASHEGNQSLVFLNVMILTEKYGSLSKTWIFGGHGPCES